jgi:ATP-dependent DNA helicase RecG
VKIKLNTHLAEIAGIGFRFLNKFKKLGIENVKNLLWHFPVRYEDYSRIYPIAELQPQQEATIRGIIKEIGGRRTWRRRLYLVEALISDESGSIRAVWFNQPYIKNILRPGRLANFSGKVALSNESELYLSNPTYELLPTHNAQPTTLHTGRIVPIYPETKGLTSKGLRYIIKTILANLEPIEEIIPQEILKSLNLPEINRALYSIHFPKTIEEALTAKKRFAFEDIFLLQLYNLKTKMLLAKEKAIALNIKIENVKKIISELPFELTPSQKKSLWEIIQDIAKPHPMNRLLQGDVGSGKTIVAAIAAITIAEQNYQTAFMAPTEILARQHYQTFSKFFPKFEGGLALLTSGEAKIFYGNNLEMKLAKSNLLKRISDNSVKVIIGTHALIQKKVRFASLAFAVVDEQHRFGVRQRAVLVDRRKDAEQTQKKADNFPRNFASSPRESAPAPHFLSMSATPIPRTLSLTLFGDLDLSLITDLPKDRKKIITKVIDPKNREKAYGFIRNEVKKGRQVFVICPRIEQSTNNVSLANMQINELRKLEIKSVKAEYEKLSKKIFPDLRVAMLHGKMKTKEKEKIMREFQEKQADILVSTSVVEVGVDIPNATIMMIEDADRFGLAQLYQFRGRVGRGAHQSYCFLFTESFSKNAYNRLKLIAEAKNGFELAEKDLKMRGPGEFLGSAQTGMPDLAMKALQNPELVKNAREAALLIIHQDPTLRHHKNLDDHLKQFLFQLHRE